MTVKELVAKLYRLHSPNATVVFRTEGPTPDSILVFDPNPKVTTKLQGGIAWVDLKPKSKKKK